MKRLHTQYIVLVLNCFIASFCVVGPTTAAHSSDRLDLLRDSGALSFWVTASPTPENMSLILKRGC